MGASTHPTQYQYFVKTQPKITGNFGNRQRIFNGLRSAKWEDAAPKSSPMKINVVQSKSTDFVKTLTLSGSWVARDTVAINAALQGQQITAVLADVGQRVKKG